MLHQLYGKMEIAGKPLRMDCLNYLVGHSNIVRVDIIHVC